jgi:sugar porter (SP) family MFS transporter
MKLFKPPSDLSFSPLSDEHDDNDDDDVDDDDDDDDDDDERDDYGPSTNTTTTATTASATDTATGSPSPSLPSLFPLSHLNRCVLIASLNSLNLGFDLASSASIAPLLSLPPWSLNSTQVTLFVSSINLTALFGVFLSSHISDKHGRRQVFLASSLTYLASLILQLLSPTFPILLLGRLLLGLSIGISLSIDPLYIAEIVPSATRGSYVSLSEIAINAGLILGYLTSLCVQPHWHYLLLSGCVIPLTLAIVIIANDEWLLESPRWLLRLNRDDRAKEIMGKLAGGDNVDEHVDEHVATIKLSLLTEEEELVNAPSYTTLLSPGQPAWLKSMLYTGVITASIQQITGVDGIQYYQHFILSESGITDGDKQFLYTLLFSLVKTAAVAVAAAKLDTCGRRKLMITSLTLTSLGILTLALPLLSPETIPSYLSLIGITVFFIGFSVGLGPVCWLIPSEIFTNSVRSKGMSMCVLFNRLFAFFSSALVIPLSDLFTPGGFYILLFTINLTCLLWVYYYLPETMNKNLDDMMGYFESIAVSRNKSGRDHEIIKDVDDDDL